METVFGLWLFVLIASFPLMLVCFIEVVRDGVERAFYTILQLWWILAAGWVAGMLVK